MNIELIREIRSKSIILLPYAEGVYLGDEALPEAVTGNTDISGLNYSKGQFIISLGRGKIVDSLVCAIDLGAYDKLTYSKLRNEYARAVPGVDPEFYENLVFVIPKVKTLENAGIVEAMAEGVLLGSYNFDRYKREKHERKFNTCFLADGSMADVKPYNKYEKILERAAVVCEGVCFARNLVNEPINELNPERFVGKVIASVEKTPVMAEILDMDALKGKKMIGVVSVGKGSPNKPYMAILKYEYSPESPTVALIGKGVTMDLGGINLKTGADMSSVRYDMAGAAAVLAVIKIISRLRIKINVYGIMPLVENVIDGNALKPGEVITYRDGTTVEIKNTDAEGRLILADGILTARELKADKIIDIATLTGNIGQALGSKIAGVFGNTPLADEIVKTGLDCGEKFWRLPLESDYRKALDSDIADISNIGSSEPGAITAALFLKEFAGDADWAHIDIAAVAASSATEGYITKGGTGFGIRTIVKLLEGMS